MLHKIYFTLLTLILISHSLNGVEITEDDHYVYTKKNWAEISENCQRELICYFNQKAVSFLANHHIPTFWNQDGAKALNKNQAQFNNVKMEAQRHADQFATSNNIGMEDLIPSGFIMGVGVTGSGNFVLGMGGSAMLTLIVIPYEIECCDKVTGISSSSYRVEWSLGGFGQGEVGVGAGGGFAVRAGLGIIWGPLPSASALQGPAIGASGQIAALQGLGFKAALLFNNITQQHNLIVMATYDMGIEVNATVQGATYYFMSGDEVANLLKGRAVVQATGSEVIQAKDIKK